MLIDLEVQDMIAKSVIEQVWPSVGQFLSPVLLVLKEDGGKKQ